MGGATLFEDVFTKQLIEMVQQVINRANLTGERVAAWDQLQQIFIDRKLAYKSQVPPEMVGVHPENRSRLGVGGSEAHHHGAQILKTGFSWAKASDAAAFEVPTDKLALEEARAVNDGIVALSGGFIPPLVQLRLLSVGGGHTNAFLRAVKAGCRSAVPALADASGNLNPAHLSVDRLTFKDAMEKGLIWLVMHHQCPQVWPELVHLVQAALNTHAKTDQSEIEVLLDIGRMRDSAVGQNKEADWKEIEAAACFCLPKCGSYVQALIAYVKAQAPELLNELSQFQKAFASQGTSRVLGSEYIAKVASLTWGPAQKFPFVMNAAMEANLASPPNRITDGFCRLMSVSTLAALTNTHNRATVQKADKLMLDARSLCHALVLDESARVKCCGLLDVRLIYHLCKKGQEAEGKVFDSIEQIAQALLHVAVAACCIAYHVDHYVAMGCHCMECHGIYLVIVYRALPIAAAMIIHSQCVKRCKWARIAHTHTHEVV